MKSSRHAELTPAADGGARHLLIGLDGAGLDVVRGFGREALPQLHAHMDAGAYAALRSVTPPATLPNWATLLTGVNPGKHGVFDFTLRSGYRVAFTAGSIRALPTWIARLDRLGSACACLFFPGTFPPEPLAHGVYVSGWDAPVAFQADASFVWPRALHRELVRRFGPERFDDLDQFDAERPGWHARLADALCARIERRVRVARWLLETRRFELFAIYFGESDTAAHHLWSLHDPRSPRRPAQVSRRDQEGLLRVYRALDRAVGELARAAGSGVELTVVSDHGSGGASDKVVYLNRALAAAGLLHFHPQPLAAKLVGAAKDVALTRLPPRLRERLFRGFGAVLPGLVESRARFGAIDMARTRVFSDELNYFPALHYNLRGREPRGCVDPREVPALRAELERALDALRDPETGARIVAKVHAREQLFHGPQLERAPDLLLELALDRGYSYNLMPSSGAPAGSGWFRRLEAGEYLGRKGRSLPGSHRERGLFIASGPALGAVGEIDLAMADASAVVLSRMSVAVPDDLDGRVPAALSTLTTAAHQPASNPPAVLNPPPAVLPPLAASDAPDAEPGMTGSADAARNPPPAVLPPLAASDAPDAEPSKAGRARVEERLRRLGYIE
jgi:predicted AlkP superfamily phosphohydrolase/phosphomutase